MLWLFQHDWNISCFCSYPTFHKWNMNISINCHCQGWNFFFRIEDWHGHNVFNSILYDLPLCKISKTTMFTDNFVNCCEVYSPALAHTDASRTLLLMTVSRLISLLFNENINHYLNLLVWVRIYVPALSRLCTTWMIDKLVIQIIFKAERSIFSKMCCYFNHIIHLK